MKIKASFYEITITWMLLQITDDKSTVVQVMNGSVPSGDKPLAESILIQFYGAIWRQLLGLNMF